VQGHRGYKLFTGEDSLINDFAPVYPHELLKLKLQFNFQLDFIAGIFKALL